MAPLVADQVHDAKRSLRRDRKSIPFGFEYRSMRLWYTGAECWPFWKWHFHMTLSDLPSVNWFVGWSVCHNFLKFYFYSPIGALVIYIPLTYKCYCTLNWLNILHSSDKIKRFTNANQSWMWQTGPYDDGVLKLVSCRQAPHLRVDTTQPLVLHCRLTILKGQIGEK